MADKTCYSKKCPVIREHTTNDPDCISHKIIFKVQVSLFTDHDMQQVLIYNEDNTIMTEFPITKELKKEFKGEPKLFYYGHIEGNKIVLDGPAPWQKW